MTGSWEAAVTDRQNTRTILADHARLFGGLQTRARQQNGAAFTSTMWDRGWDACLTRAVAAVLHLQGRVNELTDTEYLTELRKGRASIYWPLFEADPTFKADCPTCGFQRLFDARGICDQCGWEMT